MLCDDAVSWKKDDTVQVQVIEEGMTEIASTGFTSIPSHPFYPIHFDLFLLLHLSKYSTRAISTNRKQVCVSQKAEIKYTEVSS
jgi:hypothetical protein